MAKSVIGRFCRRTASSLRHSIGFGHAEFRVNHRNAVHRSRVVDKTRVRRDRGVERTVIALTNAYQSTERVVDITKPVPVNVYFLD